MKFYCIFSPLIVTSAKTQEIMLDNWESHFLPTRACNHISESETLETYVMQNQLPVSLLAICSYGNYCQNINIYRK